MLFRKQNLVAMYQKSPFLIPFRAIDWFVEYLQSFQSQGTTKVATW